MKQRWYGEGRRDAPVLPRLGLGTPTRAPTRLGRSEARNARSLPALCGIATNCGVATNCGTKPGEHPLTSQTSNRVVLVAPTGWDFCGPARRGTLGGRP